jgi:hypothetical protein
VLANDSVVATDRGPILWVRGGRPIFSERGDAEQTVPDTDEEPDTDKEKGPSKEGGEEEAPARPLPDPPERRPATTPQEQLLNLMDGSYWADRLSEALERSPLKGAPKQALRLRAVGALMDAAEVAEAIARQDMVGSHVAAVEMVGGPVGALAVELTGLDEKLRILEREGYSVPGVMDYSVEVAAAILSPFSFGKPAPYSQLVVGHDEDESALEAEIRNYEQRLREAAEDKRRRSR